MEEIHLKGGFTTRDRRLDRIPQFDPKSRQFPLIRGTALEVKPFRSYTWGLKDFLDQGTEGKCVAYSICHELLARPMPSARADIEAILAANEIYWPAQMEDAWPGGSYPSAEPQYEGTSVLAGIKVAGRMGFYPSYHWAFGVEDLARAVGYKGPAVLGINWYENFHTPDKDGWVRIGSSGISGGHAIVCIGVRVVGKPPHEDNSYFVLHNSWGPDWGKNGRCRVSWTDMRRLLAEEGECCVPDMRSRVRTRTDQ